MIRNKWKITGAAKAAVTTLLLLAVALSSCTQELAVGEQPVPNGAVRIVLSVGDTNGDTKTRATEEGTAAENRIANITVFLYGHDSQKLDFVRSIDDVASQTTGADIEWDGNALVIRGVTDQTKAYDIYVVANRTAGFDIGDFVEDTPIDKLTDAFTRIDGRIEAPDGANRCLLMSGATPNHTFNENAMAQVALERQVAKLRIKVKIDADFSAAYPDAIFGAAAGNSELTVRNVPNSSYVCGTTNKTRYDELMKKPGSSLLDYSTATMAGTEATVYLYENITMGTTPEAKDKATFMMLRLPYKLTSTAVAMTENYYKIYIQNDADAINPHQSLRNHIYDLTATIVGFGGSTREDGEEAYVTTTVRDWSMVDFKEEELGDRFRFSRITAADETVPLVDGGYVNIQGETIRVYCNTDRGGWHAVTYKGADLVHTSVTTGGVSSSTEQFVEVVFPPVTGNSAEYTIKLYHPRSGSEGGELFKTLTIKQDDGVLPNSVLARSYTNDTGTAKGWPVDVLPKRGLQISKIGNVLPTEQALPEELPIVVWSTDPKHVITSVEHGSGESNTKMLLGLEAAKYPAVNRCVPLGEGWYLPSQQEILMISRTQKYLGPSYSFPKTYYWSSSEDPKSSKYAFMSNFIRCSMGANLKTTTLHDVRCVKNL